MTDHNYTPPVPETQRDCQLEVLRRAMAGLEYALLNPDVAPRVMTDLHDEILRAYVEDDGGRAMLTALYSDTHTDQDIFPHGREFTYLASPYSDRSEHGSCIEKERFEQVAVVAAELYRRGIHVFSPIAHSHPIRDLGGELPGSFSFWETFCRRTLAMCDTVTICKLDGWEQSEGVGKEVALAKKLGKPIRQIEPWAILETWKSNHGLKVDPWPHTTLARKS